MASKKVKIKKHKIKKKAGETEKIRPDKDMVVIPISTILIILGLILVVGAGIFFATTQQDTENNVAAVVNGEKIMWDEINQRYNRLSPELQAQIPKEEILNQTINEVLLLQEAEEREITADPDTVQLLVDRVEDQFGTEEFNTRLELQGLTYEGFKEQLADTLKINQLLEQEIPELSVNESEVREFYEENKDNLRTPEQVRASHILLNTSEDAQDVLQMVEDGGNFSELASNYSIGPSAAQGGDLGYFSRGMLVPEFEQVAFNMSVGEVSGIVETEFGYHIIKVTGRRQAQEPEFEDIEALIEFNLFDSKFRLNQDKVQEYLNELRAESDIQT